MDVFVFYAGATAAWNTIQGLTLVFSPTLISTMLKPEPTKVTELESYLCTALGLAVITLGALCVLLTGAIPLSSSMRGGVGSTGPGSASSGSTEGKDDVVVGGTHSPFLVPTLWITLIHHGAAAFLMYACAQSMGSTFYAGTCISGLLCVVGAWCGLFATSGGVISRATVLDDQGSKRNSGFPFKNTVRDETKRK